jgi:hypothetical protein
MSRRWNQVARQGRSVASFCANVIQNERCGGPGNGVILLLKLKGLLGVAVFPVACTCWSGWRRRYQDASSGVPCRRRAGASCDAETKPPRCLMQPSSTQVLQGNGGAQCLVAMLRCLALLFCANVLS